MANTAVQPAIGGPSAAEAAAALRAKLLADLLQDSDAEGGLGEGDDADDALTASSINELLTKASLAAGSAAGDNAGGLTLQDVDKDLEKYQEHPIIQGILDQVQTRLG
jgi:hypothetical protein